MNNTYTNTDDDLTIGYEAPLEMVPEGRHPMVCVDIFKTWPEEQTFDGKTKTYEKIMFVFQVFPEDGARDSEGNIYRIERKLTWSLAPKPDGTPGGLQALLEKWRGKEFTAAELKSVNLSAFKGMAAWGTIVHNTRYANLQDIEPYCELDENSNPTGKPLTAPKAGPYTRRTYRKPGEKATVAQSSNSPINGGNSNDASKFVPF
jgi:hypothetical protein